MSWFRSATVIAAGFLAVFLTPIRRRKRKALWMLTAVAFSAGTLSCGGGGTTGGGNNSPPSPVGTNTVISATTSTPAKSSNDTFTATVSPLPGAQAQPSGTVQFSVDGAASGTPVALNNSAAQITTSFATAGAHSVAASYSGDATHQSSTSVPFKVTVPYTSGSAPGTYLVTVSATSGNLVHTTTMYLTVQ